MLSFPGIAAFGLAALLVAPPASPASAVDLALPSPAESARPLPAASPAPGDLELVPASAADVLVAVRSGGASVTVVNLWATWCTPCRQEFPDLMRLARTYKDRGVALVLVSGDFPSEADGARDFLAGQGVTWRSYLKSESDEAFINAFDPAWGGALPATFLYDRSGRRVHSFLGPITYETLEHQILPLLGSKS